MPLKKAILCDDILAVCQQDGLFSAIFLHPCAHIEMPRKWLSWERSPFHGRNFVVSLDMPEAFASKIIV